MVTWDNLRKEFDLSEEDERIIELEMNLIRTLVSIREEKGITQSQLAELSGVKQPTIARLEKSLHSPQLDSILKVLVPLGYTLQIVPIKKS
jgi:predicted transcriptional regulator